MNDFGVLRDMERWMALSYAVRYTDYTFDELAVDEGALLVSVLSQWWTLGGDDCQMF